MSDTENNKIINIQSFKTNVLILSFGYAILLIFGFIQSLFIPKYLSSADYGYWQLFVLYITYINILQFGFLEGILVKWAGKNIDDFKDEISTAFRFILLEQGIIIGILLLIFWVIDLPSREIALFVLIYALIGNLLTFFLLISQSTKNFKLFTIATVGRGLIFIIFMLVIFLGGYFSYIHLILAFIMAGVIVILLFIFQTHKYLFHCHNENNSLLQFGKENIGIGIFILLGNFILLTFTTIDRLFVGSFFPITQFAIYAFAATMGGIAMVFLQAVAKVVFPYLSPLGNETRKKTYNILKSALVIFWAGMLTLYFPFSVWIMYYLPQYSESLPLIAILLCTIGFSGQIQILHSNFFIVYQKQRQFFIIAGISLVGAIIFNLLAVIIFSTLTAVAIAAVISFSLWYFLNEEALRQLLSIPVIETVRWAIIIFTYTGAFLGCYKLSEIWIVGFTSYAILFVGITIIGLHEEIGQLWNLIMEIQKPKGV